MTRRLGTDGPLRALDRNADIRTKVHRFRRKTCYRVAAFDAARHGDARCLAPVRSLKTSEAATLLNVSPNTLRAWERRFGYPRPQRSPGKHRLYTHGEIAALRDALHDGLSISSAVSRAREGLSADTDALVGALSSFDRERADAALEAALALRSLERSVEEVLLPVARRGRRAGTAPSPPSGRSPRAGAASGCAARSRLAPPPVRPVSVLRRRRHARRARPRRAPRPRARAARRARRRARLTALSVRGVARHGRPARRRRPDVVVIAGAHAPRRRGRALGLRRALGRRPAADRPLPPRPPRHRACARPARARCRPLPPRRSASCWSSSRAAAPLRPLPPTSTARPVARRCRQKRGLMKSHSSGRDEPP